MTKNQSEWPRLVVIEPVRLRRVARGCRLSPRHFPLNAPYSIIEEKMRGRSRMRRACLQVWSAWFIVVAPGICSSFSAVALTDGGSPVSTATVRWNNQAVRVPSFPHETPVCSPPTVTGSAKTASDRSFTDAPCILGTNFNRRTSCCAE